MAETQIKINFLLHPTNIQKDNDVYIDNDK